MNFVILFGPMMLMGISQMTSLEPGDADFGVKLEDVRGQKEAKEEIRKVVTLWQSGDRFVASGGKRERGILFLGPPGTGKTMLAKAIATGFNSPIVLMPGSGFAQTFIGMDVIIVRYMARKARKLASKWGGQCIIFIDEIDAVGMRRAALGPGAMKTTRQVEARRDDQMPGGMMGGMGQMGLQSLLVVMDGIDNPPFFKKLLRNKLNTWLDALYVVPQRVGPVPVRVPKAKPTGHQIFFVGATNVPLSSLDPALTRPGRMGRHIHFRTPTKKDRIDIFDLYLGKVAHDPELDDERSREELARITDGYSPAQIEQACSVALTYAVHSGRDIFTRADLLEAMVTIEAGTALGWGWEDEDEERSTAVHEAGHAVASYLYEKNAEATRLSIRKRGATGGHLQSVEGVERFAYHRSELMGRLTTILGAYAAEFTFYGDNTQGVGGDLGQASHLAGLMVGAWGMGAPVPEGADEKALHKIGLTLVQVARPGDIQVGPGKLRTEALILGVAFVTAWNTMNENRAGIEKIVAALLREKEISGNDLGKLLDGAGLAAPEIDWSLPGTYPTV
jgi:ATP-dependent Zn protease